MEMTNDIIITLIALSCYGAVRVILDLLLAVDNLVSKLAKPAQTVKKVVDLPLGAIAKHPAVKQDKRHKYTVNVEACEQYLASRQK